MHADPAATPQRRMRDQLAASHVDALIATARGDSTAALAAWARAIAAEETISPIGPPSLIPTHEWLGSLQMRRGNAARRRRLRTRGRSSIDPTEPRRCSVSRGHNALRGIAPAPSAPTKSWRSSGTRRTRGWRSPARFAAPAPRRADTTSVWRSRSAWPAAYLWSVTSFSHPDFTAPALRVRARRAVRARAGRRRPPRRFLLHHQPAHLRAGRRRVAHAARAAHGLGARARRDGELWVREGRRVAKGDRVAVGDGGGRHARASTCTPPASSASTRRRRVQVHGERGVAREADRLRAHGAHPHRRARSRRLSDLGDRAGARALARAQRHALVHRATASSARCSPATPSPCTTSRRRSSARRSA